MSTSQSRSENPRGALLANYYRGVLSGKHILQTPQNGNLFIEAVCSQADPPTCVHEIISSQNGLSSMQACMRFNISPIFLNGPATELLRYIQTPALKTICGGDLLRQVILHIVRPPIFWNVFVRAYRDGSLHEVATQSFAWLLVELLSLPPEQSLEYLDLAQDLTARGLLLSSPHFEVRTMGQKIKHILSTLKSATPVDGECGPGGRHDNDFVDFRQISILPTADELTSAEPPFLLVAEAVEDSDRGSSRLAVHLDNQFRLLREDMLGEIREEIQIVLGLKKGHHKGLVIDDLEPVDIDCGVPTRRQAWGMQFLCKSDIPRLFKGKPKDRKAHLVDNRNLLKHQSLACLLADRKVVAFPTINRNADLLAGQPPIITLQFPSEASTATALLNLKTAKMISLVQIDTAVFAFAPVLRRLQEARDLPLLDELLTSSSLISTLKLSSQPLDVIQKIKADPGGDLKQVIKTRSSVRLDASQIASLLSCLTQSVSLIQGPPGTGKSFIGALIAKILHDSTNKTILVVCYTNHALDQFLEDLLDIGIQPESLVRLGGKSTLRTKPLAIFEQSTTFKHTKASWSVIDGLRSELDHLEERLQDAFDGYQSATVQKEDLMQYLEFPPEDSAFYAAFTVPDASDGMTQIGRKGKAVNRFYLLDRWIQGMDAGMFQNRLPKESRRIWRLPVPTRHDKLGSWKMEILKERASDLHRIIQEYNSCLSRLDGMFNEKNAHIIKSKRIVGCTTTAAAMYVKELQAVSPEVLLVEEAGEILESHIITALGSRTKQLILIGDHKQLRPKVNNHLLSVEKGEGYDLNRSLFERLVLKGFPHQTLTEQHRMRPEISSLIRQLTYPDLVDARKTLGRPDLRGFRDNIVFVNHNYPEDDIPHLVDRKDMNSSSKQNTFEGNMVLKCVRYLGQQGYGQEKVVVLTPYLAQLHLLRELLSKENDPILNDLDSYDLVRAGLLPAASARLSKRPIRIATIDNYQGEESEIVIATLTRSNASRDIGFMGAPERLNVLLSRARNALIMIGNAETFSNARKGKDIWLRFFDLLRRGGNVYDGFPVKCERHPDRISTLCRAEDFEQECPDGGCREPCGTMLSCAVHACPQRCHQLHDHSKMPCDHLLNSQCPKGHMQSWKCRMTRPLSCHKCDQEARALQRKQQKAFELQQKRDVEQREHARQIAELEEKMELEVQALKDGQVSKERADAIQQKKADLAAMTALASRTTSSPPHSNDSSEKQKRAPPSELKSKYKESASPSSHSKSVERPSTATHEKSPSEEEWQRQKDTENASNVAIDSIMEMIGLEDVKSQVLRIKAKIDATTRQNSNLKNERFSISLLGNPGTGKTTVARHYAKFLTLVGVLPGSSFIETTGSRLANDGVPVVKKHIEEIQNAGGGALFVDEAYQLTSQHNYGGNSILDFLLAEIENNVGKIVFIFAGYNKEMEKFFQHNPGLSRRIPYSLQFADYEDDELLRMMGHFIQRKYDGKMKVENGIDGLYVRVVIRRLGRGRGHDGFGNAGALQNMFSKISERQAERLNRERKEGLRPDDFFLAKEDLIGPDPSKAIVKSKAWTKLQDLIGLNTVKESVRAMFGFIETNYHRELRELPPIEFSLNRVFLGSPGTGKTSVAKLYGRILADLGILSNGEVITKSPADFIGSALGQSENNTKAILAATVGKVLIIDEAYMLYTGTGATGNQSDPYKTAVIDTIVAQVQSVPGEDRCVLLLGYEDQIVKMFQNVNPGLSRRFPIADAFHFQDFSDSEMRQILELKLKDQGLDATERAKSVAIEVLARARNRPNFGNAGEVENLLGKAKTSYQTRQSSKPLSERSFDAIFEAQDFDPEFDREADAATNLQKLFEDVVGCESIVSKLEGYQQIARGMKVRGLDPRDQIPTNFVFKGPPGTGKTTTARKMGKVFYDMGFLSFVEVIECSASDLIAQYVGQTGPKTRSLLEKALGRVLFIDEAYRLGEGNFASEAVDELVDIITKPKFFGKVIVILAGYDEDMNKLMAVNTGLSSRFSEEIIFRDMTPRHCLQLLDRNLQQKKINVTALRDHDSALYQEMIGLLDTLSRLPFWGNARDVQTLAKSMAGSTFKVMSSPMSPLALSSEEALDCVRVMLADRQERCANSPLKRRPQSSEDMTQVQHARPPIPTVTCTSHDIEKMPSTRKNKESTSPQIADERDAGVSDEVWNQLQADKNAADLVSKLAQEATLERQRRLEQAQEIEKAQAARAKALALIKAANDAEIDELKRKREKARLEEQTARQAREKALAELERVRLAEQGRRRQEARAQASLRQMGVCCAGFQWIKQLSGYRCAGGSHFVSNEKLGL